MPVPEIRKGTKVFISDKDVKAVVLGQLRNPHTEQLELVVKVSRQKNHGYFRPGEVTTVSIRSACPRECRHIPRGWFRYAYFPHKIIWKELPLYRWSDKPNQYNENYPVLENNDADAQAQKTVERVGQITRG